MAQRSMPFNQVAVPRVERRRLAGLGRLNGKPRHSSAVVWSSQVHEFNSLVDTDSAQWPGSVKMALSMVVVKRVRIVESRARNQEKAIT